MPLLGLLARAFPMPFPAYTMAPAVQQEWLDRAADMGEQRLKDYALYDEFYDGEHGPELRDRAKQYLEGRTGVPFSENFAEPVVDTLSERLTVIGFTSSEARELPAKPDPSDPEKPAEDPATPPTPAATEIVDEPAALCEDWWQKLRLDGKQGRVHTGALKRGDEYVIVDWDEKTGRPTFTRQLPEQCKVVYATDEPDTVAYAVKCWNTRRESKASNPDGRPVTRLNIYWPDQIEKWVRDADGAPWVRWIDDPDPETGEKTGWPTWWTDTVDEAGDSFGVAMIHFRHMPRDDGQGRSRVRKAIPFQLELNKQCADLHDLVDNHGLPQDVITGISGDLEITRDGSLWKTPSAEANAFRLDVSPTDNILNAIEGTLSRLARRMRMPLHLLTGGTPPSGESLKTAESGLVSTAKACQTELGEAWEAAFLLGLRLNEAFGAEKLTVKDDLTLEVQWENPETRSDEADLAVAEAKHRLGWSRHTLIQEMGGDPEKEAERRQAEKSEDAVALGKAFDRGVIPGE